MLHPRIQKEVRDVIALPLKIIFDTSLASGVWRTANITLSSEKVLKQKLKTIVQ